MKFRFKLDDKKPMKMSEGIYALPVGMEKLMVNLLDMEKGSEIPVHCHKEEQVSLIIKGELGFVLDGKKFRLKAGEGVLIPSNMKHGAKAIKKTFAYDCFSPPRWDYLEKLDKGKTFKKIKANRRITK
jgi:quercetin dioxygenase-like cupin family protein